MKIIEFFKLTKSNLKILSAYNGKVLCNSFNERKHKHLHEREVISIWSEIVIPKGYEYGNFAKSTICVYVSGGDEYRKEMQKKVDTNNESSSSRQRKYV